jgi:hypothetical protein
MHRTAWLVFIAVSACFLTGCNKSQSPNAAANTIIPANTAAPAISGDDPVQKKLQQLAGGTSTNCGVVKAVAGAEVDAASKCAMDSSKAKTSFYVEYQMPGMNIALAGNAQGKVYSVQSQEGGAGLATADCPAELRVAQSGRVTCYPPGAFSMSGGGGSHATMAMPPIGGANPHGGTLPAGHPKVDTNKKSPPPPAQPMP